ncbi:MAG: 3-hydroxyacyl-CoA dehydrogenase family protein [Haloarculaceae archaeon]
MHRVAVIGAGDMGHGFAVQFARHGKETTIVDHRQSNLDDARERIADAAAFLHEEGLTDVDAATALDRTAFTLDLESGVADADVVIETVTEDLDVKREAFERLGAAAPADALLSSNTSGIPITDIAEGFGFADRIVGCHWWYPPYLLPPVEVIRGEATSEDAFERLVSFVESVDRDPIEVDRDVPGFVWNRVQAAVVRECVHIVEEGVASAEDVNRAIRDGYARRTAAIGPLETVDIAGLDLFEVVGEELYPHLCDAEEPHRLLGDLVAAGKTGIDAGEGFFTYDESPAEITGRRDELVAALSAALREREER